MIVACAFCGKASDKKEGAINRARASGLNVYCGRECAGMARRKDKDESTKRAEKAEYDRQYRDKNREKRAAQKRDYHQRTYDPEKQRAYNQSRMQHHVEYCRSPEYQAKKKVYDRQYRAEKFYGELAEAFVLTLEIRDAALEKAGGDYELRLMKGTLNKSQQRKRDYERLDRKEPEECTLGNLEQGERR